MAAVPLRAPSATLRELVGTEAKRRAARAALFLLEQGSTADQDSTVLYEERREHQRQNGGELDQDIQRGA